MPNLYPTVNLPSLMKPQISDSEKKYRNAPLFDFQTGDFLRDGAGRIVMADGKEAFAQWCLKVCVTERGTKLAYSDKIGTEITSAVKESDAESVKSSIERTITEALMVNPVTEYVKNFSFSIDGDHLFVNFVVKGKNWAEEIALKVGY